jgi:transposase
MNMSFIRFKKFGNQEYAYEIETIWDKKNKKPKQKSKYLGIVVDKEKKLFERRRSRVKKNLILDFGDTYVFNEFLETTKFNSIIDNSFGKYSDTVKTLVLYNLCHPSSMRLVESWYEGNYIQQKYPSVDVSSQRISDLFKLIGDENIQRTFFNNYLNSLKSNDESIILDATSLPNQIHMPLTQWGRVGEDIDKQIRFLLVVDKKREIPLYYRYYSGDIVDVSTLKNTILELKAHGIKNTYTYFDAGYFSEDNIINLYNEKINFLTRLPSSRILYKELVKKYYNKIETKDNIVKFGKRALFVKRVPIKLFENDAYAYLIIDPLRKGRELSKLMSQTVDEKDELNQDLVYLMQTRGLMILVSSDKINTKEVVPGYYVRQTAEKMFGFSKDDLGLLPLRVHNEETLRGFLLLKFLSLIAFVQIKNQVKEKYTIEEIMLIMRNLKCKVFDDIHIIDEVRKKQKEIIEELGVIMPKNLGI